MKHTTAVPNENDIKFRLGAIALAAGGTLAWTGVAGAAVVVQSIGADIANSTASVQVGVGSPVGMPQLEAYNVFVLANTGSGILLSGQSNGGYPKASDLAAGNIVGPSGTYGATPGSSPPKAIWSANDYAMSTTPPGGTFYLGVEFNIDGGPELFGYLTETVTYAGTNASVTLASLTYDDSGAAITVGASATAAPEPASLSLLAAGAAGVTALRRRRAAKAV